MKNKSWAFTLKFIAYAVISLILAILITGVLAYAYYKIFDDPLVRFNVIWYSGVVSNVFRWANGFVYIPIALLISAALLLLFTRKTTRRISAIENAVAQISDENYRVLLPNDISDGLGAIEKGLNELAGQIKDGVDERAEAQQAKDDFIVNAAHDLRTPLTSIIGYLALISDKQVDNEISTKYAAIAFDKAKQLESIIETLFDIAAFTMDNIQISKQEVNLLRFLTQKQDEMYPQLHDADMEIRLYIPETISAINVDGDLMARVIDNLIINAIRYAKAGKYIDIVAAEQDENLLISIITHSNPVPTDELERIFDKFYRLEKSRAVSTGGSGLGLSISRRIVELHDGTLSARQTADGTAFDICLPR